MRKVYCNVLEGVTYEDRCLFALSQIIEANPVCENCLVRELRRLKVCGVQEVEVKPLEKARLLEKKKPKAARREPKDVKRSGDVKKS